MTHPRWVTAHGKHILVETLETPGMKALEPKKHEQFVKLPLQWAADAAKVTGTRGAMVWILLLHTAWKTKSTTFPERVAQRIAQHEVSVAFAHGDGTRIAAVGRAPCVPDRDLGRKMRR